MDKILLQELSNNGLSFSQIAKQMGVNRARIKYLFRKFKLKGKTPIKLNFKITEEMLSNLIKLNLTIKAISIKLNCSETTVKYWLNKFKLKTIPLCGRNVDEQGKINEDASKNIFYKCSKCNRLLKLNEDNFYILKSGKPHSWCIKCNDETTLLKQRGRKQECLDYLGGKCVVCEYSKYNGALEFHHVDPSKKLFHIGKLKLYSLEKLKPELDKCVILCANCHKEFHGGLIKLPDNIK